MNYNFVFNEENRPIVVAIEEFPQDNGILLEAPDGFDITHSNDWRYEEGTWIYDPLPEPEPPQEMETVYDVINALLGVTE